MNFSLINKVAIIFSFLIVVVLLNFLILTGSDKEVVKRHYWVVHTHEVIKETERLLGYMRDAETGQRGFLLTLDDNYLEPFYNGAKEANATFFILQELTEDNKEQQVRLDHIKDLMHQKITELEDTIGLAKKGKMTEEIEIVNSDLGKNIMDNIRDRLSEISSVEENLLIQRNVEYANGKERLYQLFYASIMVLVAFIFVSFLFVQKTIVRPLTDISKFIIKEKGSLYLPEIKIKTTHYEIKLLIAEFNKLFEKIKYNTKRKDDLISELQIALDEIKVLRGFLPICSNCKSIRDDEGYWNKLEAYVSKYTDVEFSHGICPECVKELYPEILDKSQE